MLRCSYLINAFLTLLEPLHFLLNSQFLVYLSFHELQVIRSQSIRNKTKASEEPTSYCHEGAPHLESLFARKHPWARINLVKLTLHSTRAYFGVKMSGLSTSTTTGTSRSTPPM